MSNRQYREQIARHALRLQRRASFNGADGPAPSRTPEEQSAYKAERAAAHQKSLLLEQAS